MLLTSRYTLDKRSETMRADLARKAELVGVVRLPSSTFARQAGTEAVTDVLVLRRRERTLDHTPDEAWIHSTPIAVPGYQDVTVNVNQAVANDMPTHAVGDIRPVIGRFGGDFDVVFQGDTERIGERLRTLLSMQITHGRPPLQLGEMEPAERAEVIVRPDHVTPFEYSVDQRGVVWYGDGATVTEAAHGQGDEARRLRGMIRLRDLARELQRLELDPAHVDDPAVETKRKELDQAYDRFTGEFGRLNDRANRRAYDSEESGRHLVMALEETDEKGRFVGKAKCLSQRTISPVPPMPDHADSLDDALNISLDRAGRVDLELIARLADTTVEEAEAGLGDRIIRDPYTGTVMPAEDYLTGDVGTKLDRVTAMADRLKRRAGTEAMTEFTASTYATPEDMPATERAGEWISEAGADVWRSLKDPYSAESYRDPAPVIERIAGRNAWTMGWSRNPELVLALAWRAVEELPEQHARVTLERSDTGERKPWHAPAWHQSHGTSPLWDALCWTWRDGDAPQNYAPILAARDMPVTDLALFVHKIAHTDRLDIADKTAILSNLFESWRADDANGRPSGRTRPSARWHALSCPAPTSPHGSPNGSPPTCPSANGSGASPANCQTDCARRGSTTPTASRHAPSTRAPTTTGSSERAARSSSDNGVSSRSAPRPRTPTRRTRNGSNTWPACWNACSPPHWRPSRSRRRWEPRGSPPGTSTTS